MKSPIWGDSTKSANVTKYVRNRSLNTSEFPSYPNIGLALDLKAKLVGSTFSIGHGFSYHVFFLARHYVLGAMFKGGNKAWASFNPSCSAAITSAFDFIAV